MIGKGTGLAANASSRSHPAVAEESMTHFETSRVNELIRSNITGIREAAARLSETRDLQELEKDLAEVERAVAELKSTLAGLPYQHSSRKE